MFKTFARPVLIATIGTFATAVTAASPAAASGPTENRSAAVRYGDLDLKTADGATELNRRVARAASRICAAADPRDLGQVAAAHSCRSTAIANAQPSIQLAVNAARADDRMAANAISIHAAH